MLHSICLLLAIIWLINRLYNFLCLSVNKMIQSLNVKIPPAVKVSIDRITNTGITIHWENEPDLFIKNGSIFSGDINCSNEKEDTNEKDNNINKKNKPKSAKDSKNPIFINDKSNSISHYILYLNNIQLGVFPNVSHSLYTCCSITNLESDTKYQIDFVTVNKMGFINKLPSIFCMTQNNNIKDTKENLIKNRNWRRNTINNDSQIDVDSILNDNNNSNNNNNDNSDDTLNNNNNLPQVTSYSSIVNLKDLENYSINNLKKILISAQEDLHDVLQQQTQLLEEFKESKVSLELELDNLKIHWSYEIDYRKSLKSNIKSLENSKLLSDIKFDKLNVKIEQTDNKINKMENEIKKWVKIEDTDLNTDKIRLNYKQLNEKLIESIDNLEGKVIFLQNETSQLEQDNKELNSMRKSSSSTTLNKLNTNSTNGATNNNTLSSISSNSSANLVSLNKQLNDEFIRLNKIIKKIYSYTSKTTGLLTPKGEEYLNSLNQDSSLVKLVREQFSIDQENDENWEKTRQSLIKKILMLEEKFDRIDSQNRDLRGKLLAQPYSNDNHNQSFNYLPPIATYNSGNSSNNKNSNMLTMSLTHSNSNVDDDSNGNNNNSDNSPNVKKPLLANFAPMEQSRSYLAPLLANQNSMLLSQLSNSNSNINLMNNTNNNDDNDDNEKNSTNNFPYSMATTATVTTNAMALPLNSNTNNGNFGWDNDMNFKGNTENFNNTNNNLSHHHNNDSKEELDYDTNNNHLLTGLQDMIYDEGENISTFSRGFTVDQLDDYWNTQDNKKTAFNQKTQIQTDENGKSYPILTSNNNDFSNRTPLTTHPHNFATPLSKSPFSLSMSQPKQSLLSSMLNDSNNLSPFANDDFSYYMSPSQNPTNNNVNNIGSNLNNNNISSMFATTNTNEGLMGMQTSLSPQNSNVMDGSHNFNTESQYDNIYDMNSQQQSLLPNSIDRAVTPPVANTTRNNGFRSPSFNFLWHNSPNNDNAQINEKETNNMIQNSGNNGNKNDTTEVGGNSKSRRAHFTPLSTPDDNINSNNVKTHKRNKSSNSNKSGWSNRLSLKSKSVSVSSQETATKSDNEGDNHSNVSNTKSEHSNGEVTPSHSSSTGRKMSRLLSRTTMNDLFKLRNHDSSNSNV